MDGYPAPSDFSADGEEIIPRAIVASDGTPIIRPTGGDPPRQVRNAPSSPNGDWQPLTPRSWTHQPCFPFSPTDSTVPDNVRRESVALSKRDAGLEHNFSLGQQLSLTPTDPIRSQGSSDTGRQIPKRRRKSGRDEAVRYSPSDRSQLSQLMHFHRSAQPVPQVDPEGQIIGRDEGSGTDYNNEGFLNKLEECIPLLTGNNSDCVVEEASSASWISEESRECDVISAGGPSPRIGLARRILHKGFRHTCRFFGILPAVLVGLLLNVLDATSYGIIMFPTDTPEITALAADGISVFLASGFISQFVFCFFSVFRGGNTSQMVEALPFIHSMAHAVVALTNSSKNVASTVIVAVGLSSALTGVVFLALGLAKLGFLAGFFPRHILVGSIGGVGLFLCITGLEVAVGRPVNFLDKTFLSELVSSAAHIGNWLLAAALAIALKLLSYRVRHILLMPIYFVSLGAVFWTVTWLFPRVDWSGWYFQVTGGRGSNYLGYWEKFHFEEVQWNIFPRLLPTMLSLTFFGLLHVPINVPGLALSLKYDVDLDRELIVHGLSNVLAGIAGVPQNYLVYSNSVFFYRSGGDSRLATLVLGISTVFVWMAGTSFISYVPKIVVTCLIFFLGVDLLMEALIDTWPLVSSLEYFTICAIILCMGLLGFTEGVFLGVLLALVIFVYKYSQKPVVRYALCGSQVHSAVSRSGSQRKYLKIVGSQIQIIRLQGYLFFGTVNQVDALIAELISDNTKPTIRFLILDFRLVQGIDFSVAEAFAKLHQRLLDHQVYLVTAEASPEASQALSRCGIVQHEERLIKTFQKLASALEWCENTLLNVVYGWIEARKKQRTERIEIPMPDKRRQLSIAGESADQLASARDRTIARAAEHFVQRGSSPGLAARDVRDANDATIRHFFEELGALNLFFKLRPFFTRVSLPQGAKIWERGDPADCLYIVEEGSLLHTRSAVDFHIKLNGQALCPSGGLEETILPSAMVGDYEFLGGRTHETTLVAAHDSIVFRLGRDALSTLNGETKWELAQLSLVFLQERWWEVVQNVPL